MIFYIDKDMALAGGLTHTGHVYGMPAWFDADMESDEVYAAVLKVPLMTWWPTLGEALLQLAAWAFPGQGFTAPIRVTGPIE